MACGICPRPRNAGGGRASRGSVRSLYARSEGRTISWYVSGNSRLLTGLDASESALKTADLQSFGVLHFATHALVDDASPERSAIILTAGASGDDGLLQAREIADLRCAAPSWCCPRVRARPDWCSAAKA